MVLVGLVEVVNIEQASYVARKKTKFTIPSLKSEFKESVHVEHCSFAILRRVVFLSSPEKLEVAPSFRRLSASEFMGDVVS